MTALLIMLISLPLQAACPQPLRLRVMTYNIQHGLGFDQKLNLGRTLAAIRRANADVIALQEVDRGAARTARVDQAAYLATQLGMDFAFAAGRDFADGGQSGVAVLSRWQIRAEDRRMLGKLLGNWQRVASIAEINYRNLAACPFAFIATHLQNGSMNEADRISEINELNALGQAMTLPAVLGGDLNAGNVYASRHLLSLQWTYANTLLEERNTVPADKPGRQLDYLLYLNRYPFGVLRSLVPSEPSASDHRPLVADLNLPRGSY